MKPVSVMLIAGETSGDTLAAELVVALRLRILDRAARAALATADCQPLTATLAPRFFGAGGPRMADAGVDLALDLTAHAVFGLAEVLRQLWKFRRLLDCLLDLAFERQPEVIVLVDYAGFNRRFATAVRRRLRLQQGPFVNWRPKIVYFVSPQVWASRENRAYDLERDIDLLLSIFPFEKAWYAQRTPRLRVEFVGHPIVDRFPHRQLEAGSSEFRVRSRKSEEEGEETAAPRGESATGSAECGVQSGPASPATMEDRRGTTDDGPRTLNVSVETRDQGSGTPHAGHAIGDRQVSGVDAGPLVVLLPGSRAQEVRRHLAVMAAAMPAIRARTRARFCIVLPDERLVPLARSFLPLCVVGQATGEAREARGAEVPCRIGGLSELLARADLAIAKSGTVTLECAWFGVPAVVLYRVARPTWWVARHIVRVPYAAMPNLLAGEAVYPEFIQSAATAANVAREAIDLLTNAARREAVRRQLGVAVASLGGPGACRRAADAIVRLFDVAG